MRQIVPRLPPAIDGVGDYALSLARQLRLDYGLDTHFTIGYPTWPQTEQVEGFQTAKLTTCSTEALLNQLDPKYPVSLHYVGYSYAKKGCPI